MAKKPTVSIIAAMERKTRAIGKDNELLWSIPSDLKRFKKITSGHPVIMGRKTWESIPKKFRPLPQRENIVITRDPTYNAKGAEISHSIENAIQRASSLDMDEVFIIGGETIYEQAIHLADRLYITLVDTDTQGDTFFPPYEEEFTRIIENEKKQENGLNYEWTVMEKR